jgi:hypothetical protein
MEGFFLHGVHVGGVNFPDPKSEVSSVELSVKVANEGQGGDDRFCDGLAILHSVPTNLDPSGDRISAGTADFTSNDRLLNAESHQFVSMNYETDCRQRSLAVVIVIER